MNIHIHVSIYICMYIYIHISLYVYICIYIYVRELPARHVFESQTMLVAWTGAAFHSTAEYDQHRFTDLHSTPKHSNKLENGTVWRSH